LKQIRKRLTYANVMSSLAVFLLLGGATAFAATKIGANEIKANSIKTGKIVKEAVTAGKLKNGAVTETKIADGAVTTNKLANDAVTGDKAKASTFSQVPSAASATNADTVGGNHLGFAHITFSGGNPTVDTAQSSAGVTVTKSNPFVAATSCVQAPFALHSVVGSVDFVADPGSSEIVEATVVTGTGHRCPEGQIEVNTQNANANTGVTVDYYLIFS
jgi:hypothetical protein